MGKFGDFVDAVGPAVKKIAGSIKDEVSTALFNDFVEEMECEIRKALCVPADKPIVRPLKNLFKAYLGRENEEIEPEGPNVEYHEEEEEEEEEARERGEKTDEMGLEEAEEEGA